MNSEQPWTVVDLFAGAGGLSEGLRLAGADIRLGVEEDAWAADTFGSNHDGASVVAADVRSLSDQDLRLLVQDSQVDLVVGGPPCQGFSVSNLRSDASDPRNELFRDFLRLAEGLSPRACVIENVPGLLRRRATSGRPVIDEIMLELRRRGWHATFTVLNAADFGVPQVRERLFIVAFKDRRDLESYMWPEATHNSSTQAPRPSLFDTGCVPAVTLWDAIGDLAEAGDSYTGAPRTDFQRWARREGLTTPPNHEPMRHTERIVERFRSIGFGQDESDVAEQHAPRRRGDSASVSDRRYGQNSRRQRPDRPCSTVVASSHTNFIHPYFHRNFTVRELARVQSFHDSFVFRGKRAVLSRSLSEKKGLVDDLHLDQRAQVGNAVPPLLSAAIGQSIMVLDGRRQLAAS